MELHLEHFARGLSAGCQPYTAGAGTLEPTDGGLRLTISHATAHTYSDAQLDDYRALPRRRFPWRPPLRLTVHARFSHLSADQEGATGPYLRGTAGFGFWNDPFMMTGTRPPTLPRAVWFFYGSPPSNLKLDSETPGSGWKAATLDACRPVTLPLAIAAPLLVPLMNAPGLYRRIWPVLQRALGIRERLITAPMTEWHTYQLDWETERATFRLDGAPILEDAPTPRGPLGFVLWLDNQTMVATPWGRLRWGLLPVPGPQWIEVDRLEINPLAPP